MRSTARIVLLLGTACLAAAAHAQSEGASVEDMVRQLQKPRTRNLLIQKDAAPRPSLSLLIHFDFDSASVRPDSQEPLARLAMALRAPELENARFAVEGHTDAQGRADYNQALSQRRAQAVRDVLVRAGVEAQRLAPVGKGASEPADPADPRSPLNRRVRVVNLD